MQHMSLPAFGFPRVRGGRTLSRVCHWIERTIRIQTFLQIDGWNACQLFLPSPNILRLYFLRAQLGEWQKSEIERCGIAIHLSIPMHRFIDAPIHRTDSNASFITDASGLNRCIGTELMNRFKIITDYYRCIGKNYQCIGNLAMHRI